MMYFIHVFSYRFAMENVSETRCFLRLNRMNFLCCMVKFITGRNMLWKMYERKVFMITVYIDFLLLIPRCGYC